MSPLSPSPLSAVSDHAWRVNKLNEDADSPLVESDTAEGTGPEDKTPTQTGINPLFDYRDKEEKSIVPLSNTTDRDEDTAALGMPLQQKLEQKLQEITPLIDQDEADDEEVVISPVSIKNENVEWRGMPSVAQVSYDNLMQSSQLLLQSASLLRSPK